MTTRERQLVRDAEAAAQHLVELGLVLAPHQGLRAKRRAFERLHAAALALTREPVRRDRPRARSSCRRATRK